MKVLLVNSLYAPDEFGGAETSVRLLASSLYRKGVEVAVAATAERDHENLVDGVRVHYTRTPNRYWIGVAKAQSLYNKALWHMRDAYNTDIDQSLRTIVRREDPQIVHTHNLSGWSTYVWNLARSEKRRLIHTIRDHYLLCTRSTMFKGSSNCESPCTVCSWHSRRKQRGYTRLDAVTGVSDYIIERHQSYQLLPEAKRTVRIPNAFDPPASDPLPRRPTANLTFGYVGALAPHKGIELLLKAFATGAPPNTRLALFGAAPSLDYDQQLRQRYESRAVTFQGRKDPSEIYPQIDVLVVPSLSHEAFGRVVIEAYSYGVPVIASHRGGLSEIVRDGITGLLFDPDHASDLRSRLEALAADPARVASMASACRIESDNYSSDKIADQYLTLYQDVLS